MGDLSKPRKPRNSVDNIEDAEQKAVAKIIDYYIKKSGYTKKVFAEIYPKVSLSTLNNIYKPKYGRKISSNVLRQMAVKISYIFGDVSAEKVYIDLLNAAQIDISKNPFEKKDNNEALTRTDMLFYLAQEISNMRNPGKIIRNQSVQFFLCKDTIETLSGVYEMVVNYSEQELPIDYWAIDTNMGNDGGYDLKQTFIKILLDGSYKYPNSRVKYSFLTNNIDTFNMFTKMEIPALNLYLSVIYYTGGVFKEVYIRTGKKPDILDEKGLTIK